MRIRRLVWSGATAAVATALVAAALPSSASAADPAPTVSEVGTVALTATTGTAPLVYSGDRLTYTVTLYGFGVSVGTIVSTCFVTDTDRTVDLIGGGPVLPVPSQVVVPAGQCTASFTVTAGTVAIRTPAGFGAVTSDDPDPNADAIGSGATVFPAPGSPGADTLRVVKGKISTHSVNITVASTIPTARVMLTLRLGGHNPTTYSMFSDGQGNYSFLGNPDAVALPALVYSDHGGYLLFTG